MPALFPLSFFTTTGAQSLIQISWTIGSSYMLTSSRGLIVWMAESAPVLSFFCFTSRTTGMLLGIAEKRSR